MRQVAAILDRCAAEPHRVFFPLGVLASLAGVLLWPAYFAGWTAMWPAEAHARWMVGGFGGCFVVGFLGTAGPRLLGADPWCRFEILLHGSMSVAMMCCLAFQRIAAADLLLGLWLIGVLSTLAFRLLVGRQDVPPPGFPVAVLGVAGAAGAGIALSLDPVIGLAAEWRSLWRLLYFQGLLWLPVLGVSPYLLPRFFGISSRHSFETSRTIPAGWWKWFSLSAAAGALLLASFAIEAWIGMRSGLVLRATVVTAALAVTVPGLFDFRRANGLGWAMRVVPLAATSGWLLAAWLLPLKTGMLHLMFIGGAGLLMLAVACRVILGHAGRHDRLMAPMRWCHWLWGLMLFVATTRVIADVIPTIRVSHYIYAAGMWAVGVAFWAWKIRREKRAPGLRCEPEARRCPRRGGSRARSRSLPSAASEPLR